MKYDSLLAALGIFGAAAVGCYTGGGVDVNGTGGSAPTIATDPTITVEGDLPCDLVQALATCASCHGNPPSGGAPNRLLTYDDLAAPSRSDPTQTVAQLSIVRMKNTKSPMPPSGIAATTDTAVVEAWIAAGMPKGTCGGVDGGAGYGTPSVCTSGTTYTRGHNTQMRPGGACISCHASDEGPSYGIAGTVYPTAHEPDDCNGASDPDLRVVITDANGQSFSLTVNAAGNFVYPRSVATPYTAKVVSGAKTRAMASAQTEGDCNTCHTEQGTSKAPGRIMAP